MGARISRTEAYYDSRIGEPTPEVPKQVLWLAERSLTPLLSSGPSAHASHLIVSTTCPDMLSPSLGQMINERFNAEFSRSHTIDLVQGCAGGVSAMILGSQLAKMHRSSVIVVQSDAARKATSKTAAIHSIFGNGSFACLIEGNDTDKDLLHFMSRQYKGLSEVVTVRLGHDAHGIITSNKTDVSDDPRKHLGLSMNNMLAMKLLRNAESFYREFVRESTKPDVMILHQVNPGILKLLGQVFAKYGLRFIDSSSITGNCGAASVGIALHLVREELAGQKVMLCSFGTGGVITAGMWQY